MVRKREGFTLVELLVVIAIIIVLAAILFPVFARARDKAQQSKCLNNLKQMGNAIAMYEEDYDNPMPFQVISMPAATGLVPIVNPAYYYFWKDLMEPYVKQLKGGQYYGQFEEYEGELFKCPSAPIEHFIYAWQEARTYGYNPYFTKVTSTSDVRYPSSTLRVTETSTDDPDNLPARLKGGSWQCPLPNSGTHAPGWHNDMNVVLWADGHVSTMTRQRVMLTDNLRSSGGWASPRTGDVWTRFAPKPAYTPEG